jgi:hypothetical protein
MSDHSAQMLSILAEMRDLLRLVAEPAIAERDKKLREALLVIGGKAGKMQETITGNHEKILLAGLEEQQSVDRFNIEGARDRDQHRLVCVNGIGFYSSTMVECMTRRAQRYQVGRVVTASSRDFPDMMHVKC